MIPKLAHGDGEYTILEDIGKDNDLSANAYTLYVHSAETDKIKYAVPLLGRIDIFGFNNIHARQSPVKLFKKGADFDFREYDRHFLGEQPLTGGYDFGLARDKFNAVKLRLRYGCELDEETRLKYRERYIGLIKSAFFIFCDLGLMLCVLWVEGVKTKTPQKHQR